MALQTPLVAVNAKTYAEATGDRAEALARAIADVASDSGVGFALALQPADLHRCRDLGVPLLAQHFDPVPPGSATGHLLAESLAANGAVGSLVNHAERRLRLADIGACVSRAKALGWTTIVCTNDAATSAAAAALGPDLVAVEPPELIGGDIAVTTADPGVVSGSVRRVAAVDPKVKVLCGAGVKTGADVAKAVELGAAGVLLASGVVKAKDWRAALTDLVSQM